MRYFKVILIALTLLTLWGCGGYIDPEVQAKRDFDARQEAVEWREQYNDELDRLELGATAEATGRTDEPDEGQAQPQATYSGADLFAAFIAGGVLGIFCALFGVRLGGGNIVLLSKIKKGD